MNSTCNTFGPAFLDDFAFNDPASKRQIYDIVHGNVQFPKFKSAICLHGAYGTGKTTLARLLPSLLEATANMPPSKYAGSCFQSPDYSHFHPCGLASHSTTLIKEIHSRTKSDVMTSKRGYFYEILDEADILGPQAQASLKALIAPANCTSIFIFTTNNPQSLDGGLVDRSYMIEMNQPKPSHMLPIGRRIWNSLPCPKGDVSDETLLLLAAASKGSYRDFGAALQQLATR